MTSSRDCSGETSISYDRMITLDQVYACETVHILLESAIRPILAAHATCGLYHLGVALTNLERPFATNFYSVTSASAAFWAVYSIALTAARASRLHSAISRRSSRSSAE